MIGGLLGWMVVYWSYRWYWFRLSSVKCDEFYVGLLGVVEDGLGYGRLRDEEEGVGGRNVGYELRELNSR